MHFNEEKVIWQGGPSQVLNFKKYMFCVLSMLLYFPLSLAWEQYIPQYPKYQMAYKAVTWAIFILPVLYALSAWLRVKAHSYRISSERFTERYGVLHAVTEDLELYRVKDTTIYEPLSLRIFGCGNVILYTSDRSSPVIVIQAVKEVAKLQSLIRHQVELVRASKGVVEIG